MGAMHLKMSTLVPKILLILSTRTATLKSYDSAKSDKNVTVLTSSSLFLGSRAHVLFWAIIPFFVEIGYLFFLFFFFPFSHVEQQVRFGKV